MVPTLIMLPNYMMLSIFVRSIFIAVQQKCRSRSSRFAWKSEPTHYTFKGIFSLTQHYIDLHIYKNYQALKSSAESKNICLLKLRCVPDFYGTVCVSSVQQLDKRAGETSFQNKCFVCWVNANSICSHFTKECVTKKGFFFCSLFLLWFYCGIL